MVQPPSWDDLRVLLEVHRHQSLLAAARALGTSISTVARRLDTLEADLGRRLVRRTNSGTTVEPAALAFLSAAEAMERDLAAAQRDERPGEVAGTVRLAAGEGFTSLLTRALASLRRHHPRLRVELIVGRRPVDLARREADLGVRTVPSSSRVLVQRALGSVTFGLYGSTEFVETRVVAAPLSATDLRRTDFVTHDAESADMPQHRWLVSAGATQFPFRSNSEAALLDAMRSGVGIGLLPRAQGDLEPTLVRVGCSLRPLHVPVFLAYHRDLRRDARIAAVVRVAAAAIQSVISR